jgi:hypothetical protein
VGDIEFSAFVTTAVLMEKVLFFRCQGWATKAFTRVRANSGWTRASDRGTEGTDGISASRCVVRSAVRRIGSDSVVKRLFIGSVGNG